MSDRYDKMARDFFASRTCPEGEPRAPWTALEVDALASVWRQFAAEERAAEREACAQLAETAWRPEAATWPFSWAAEEIAQLIRARGDAQTGPHVRFQEGINVDHDPYPRRGGDRG